MQVALAIKKAFSGLSWSILYTWQTISWQHPLYVANNQLTAPVNMDLLLYITQSLTLVLARSFSELGVLKFVYLGSISYIYNSLKHSHFIICTTKCLSAFYR